MQKQSLSQSFRKLFTLKPKNKYKLKRSCTLLEPFCKSKFSQLCVNYRGPHVGNTIVLSKNTDLEQSTTLEIFKERFNAYLFTLTILHFCFHIVLSKNIRMSHKEFVI